MHHIVLHLAKAVSLDKKQLSCSAFDGVDTLVIGDASEQCIEKRCFARRGSTCDHKADAVSDAHFEECNHFFVCHSAFDDVDSVDSLRMQKTDGNGNTAIVIHNGTLDCGNTGIVRQMSLGNRCGIVDDHPTVMEQALDNIHGMTGRVEMFVEFFQMPIRPCDDDIIPGVDIDLVDVGRAEIRS